MSWGFWERNVSLTEKSHFTVSNNCVRRGLESSAQFCSRPRCYFPTLISLIVSHCSFEMWFAKKKEREREMWFANPAHCFRAQACHPSRRSAPSLPKSAAGPVSPKEPLCHSFTIIFWVKCSVFSLWFQSDREDLSSVCKKGQKICNFP